MLTSKIRYNSVNCNKLIRGNLKNLGKLRGDVAMSTNIQNTFHARVLMDGDALPFLERLIPVRHFELHLEIH